MTSDIVLTPIVAALPPEINALRAESAQEGHRFLTRLATEWLSGEQRFDRPGEALLAAFSGSGIAGIGGITVDPTGTGALRMRRFYVRPSQRRRGIGRLLAVTLMDRAREAGQPITVNAGTPLAAAFWEALGFVPDARHGHTHRFTVR